MSHWLLKVGSCASLVFLYSSFGKVDASSRSLKYYFNSDRKSLPEKSFTDHTVCNNIFLIRHGQYFTAGQTDSSRDLTFIGEEQAMATGYYLKSMNFPYKKIIHSSLTRAVTTAKFLEHYLRIPMECCPFLNECIPISPDPLPAHFDPNHRREENIRLKLAYENYFQCPSESDDCDKYNIIVCHSNVIRYFICRSLQIPPAMWIRFSLSHCSISWIQLYSNGTVRVRSIGDRGHIPANRLTV
ncbi:serine/threonine-protein phosphatase PGAM5, mitochondrial-like [Stegodyphus dumicola]|uniref:serine/threonine-protein phosphatase PGAM5, mitochondrial-like n=1 Tax=Stegodyphus dumicola TaxID=202533 RepID=UPI0015ABBF62|nr:serine/threonine-protein phosphatase PGAM5, mitochondrial-like [Stegodyphus dumicola]